MGLAVAGALGLIRARIAARLGEPNPEDPRRWLRRLFETREPSADEQRVRSELAADLGRGTAGLVNALDADVVTLGGLAGSAPGRCAARFRAGVRGRAHARAPRRDAPEVVTGPADENEVLVGVAMAAFDAGPGRAAASALGRRGAMSYRRDAFTWTAFGALFAFGYLMAILGPALPYIRSVEGIPYLVGALHQVAWAIGGGLAGVLSARGRIRLGRRTMIATGIAGGALAGLAVGYGEIAPVTIAGAFLMGLLATLALIRVWAALADAHGARRAVAMTEGEVAVSLAGVATPLLIASLAASAATWRLAFAIGTVTGLVAAAAVLRTDFPAPKPAAARAPPARAGPADARDHLRDRRPGVRAQLLARQLPQRRRRSRSRHRGRAGQRALRLQPRSAG